MRREHAVVEHAVDPRPRGERGELFERLQRLEQEMAQEAGVTEVSGKVVELRGFEPLTPRLPALCSPN
jgi:hypothetical protein